MVQNFSFAAQRQEMGVYATRKPHRELATFIKQSSRMSVSKLRANNRISHLYLIISKHETVYACIYGTEN
jgi:hypothetical protein